jgi:transcriptional regulator with XRE-family HTH domain
MSERWNRRTAQRFFTRACPTLLHLWAIAYWSLTPGRHSPLLRQAVDAITQCVVVIGEDRLRIAKAEGRPPGVQGSVFRRRHGADGGGWEPAPAAARLGVALRALRIQRHLSQAELAQVAGVSASAISQVERGRRGLSLDTLLTLTARLNITLDELLRGEIARGYRLARRTEPDDSRDRLLTLLDDPQAGVRASLSHLAPGKGVIPPVGHDGIELIAVASGLVQVVLPTGRPVLRQGEVLLAESSGVTSWHNVGERDALVFWVLRDDVGTSHLPRA